MILSWLQLWVVTDVAKLRLLTIHDQLLDTLITSKTRIKLLMKFFLNPGMSAHLRGLQEEFHESTNGIRIELNRLEEAGMLTSTLEGQKKVFRVATEHPLYSDINSIVRKYLGLDKLVEQVVAGLGGLEKVYLVGSIAEGKMSEEMSVIFLGDLNGEFLVKVISKAESLINKTISYEVYTDCDQLDKVLEQQKHLLLWQA